jgi:hypothetical protein
MRRKPDRLVGYATIRREIIDISRSTFLRAVKARAFGPAVIVGAKRQIKVSERRVIAWRDSGGKSISQMIHERDSEIEHRRGGVEGMEVASQRRARPVAMNTLGSVAALEGTP